MSVLQHLRTCLKQYCKSIYQYGVRVSVVHPLVLVLAVAPRPVQPAHLGQSHLQTGHVPRAHVHPELGDEGKDARVVDDDPGADLAPEQVQGIAVGDAEQQPETCGEKQGG